MPQQFASDNNAGLCPEALDALVAANRQGHAMGYGEDAWTERACERLRALFETDCAVFFAFNGTAANSLALAQLCRPYHAVIAHAESHVATDEAGAPAFFSGGAALLTVDTPLAKLTPAAVEALAASGRGVHSVKPRALSLTQATEMGTVYTRDELAALTEAARRFGLKVHMDGARFANAVAALACAPAELAWRAGVDVLCFGGVKNGLAVGEAVLFFDKGLACEFEWRVKQAGHLNSKMRLVAAPWVGLLGSGAWLKNAWHANAMARRLWEAIAKVPGVDLMAPVESNAVFVRLPAGAAEGLKQKGWRFYPWGDGFRLMCAWDTAPETVDRLAADVVEYGGAG
ncbi:MAG: low specificity L-threonine aldolase [Hyphomicrobiaceae bacterium]|nr:low specificity L-threonine aldolase [Hyphomicrobiaceae bacterium]